jgi:hypothetical protein
MFTNTGKCEEGLKKIEQTRKANRTLNGLLMSKHISLNTKELIVYLVVGSNLSHVCES